MEIYKRSRGNAGIDGVQFQIGVSTVFLLNALRELKDWRMSTENIDAGKFDDVVIELSDGTSALLQAKNKDTKNKIIGKDQLLCATSKNADFSLPKYFFSYQKVKSRFNVGNIIICTNADVDRKTLEDHVEIQQANSDSVLHLEGEDCPFVTFKESILSDLRANSEKYYDHNIKGVDLEKAVITDENLKEFLEKLQFFVTYPSGDKLGKAIDLKLLPKLTSSELWLGASYKELFVKIEGWFKQVHGEYLTESRSRDVFCEIKSDQFCKTLKDYHVSFESIRFGLEEEGRRVYHVNVERGHLLQTLRTFHALQREPTLFVNPDDGLEVYRQAIETFRWPKYKWLVLILHKNINPEGLCGKLQDILDTYSHKKVILIGNKQSVQKCALKDDILEINGSVTVKSLSQSYWERLIRKEIVNYQGKKTSLREILGAASHEDYDRALGSEGLEKLVRGEEIRLGTPLFSSDQNFIGYIHRTIEREIGEEGNGALKDTFNEETIHETKEKSIIISDSAGTGKSTVLARIAAGMKEKWPHLWIIRIELNEYSRILKDFRRRKRRTIKITDLLNSRDATRIGSPLEKFVFCQNRRVVVMMDGFDEISPDYTELALSALKQCQEETNFAKAFVTTRPHIAGELEDLLKVKPFLLQPFTTKDQVAFLSNYWSRNLKLSDSSRNRCEKYATSLIDRIPSWVKANHSFIAIPLQVRILAEIFQENLEGIETRQWESCKEFLAGGKEEPGLPEKLNVTKLYDLFIEKKLNIFLDKANPTGTPGGYDSYESSKQKYFMNHQSFAIDETFGDEIDARLRPLFSHQRDKNVASNLLKIGIVHMVNGKMQFFHETCSEYFIAKDLLKISGLDRRAFSQNHEIQQFFIDDILCDPRFTVTRYFIESSLEGVLESLPKNIFEEYRRHATSDPTSQKRRSELLHLLAREGHLSILRMILRSICFQIQTLDVATDEADNTLKDLQGLVGKHGMDIEDELGNTPLLCAVQGAHMSIVKYLMEQGANINHRNHEGASVLHLAASNGDLEAMKFLMEHGADIAALKKNVVSLHWAARKGHLEVCQYLVERGVDVNRRDRDGSTALHLAIAQGHLNTSKILVAAGADVNIKNGSGLSALEIAAQGGHLSITEFLAGT